MNALQFGTAWVIEGERLVTGRGGHPCRIFSVSYVGRDRGPPACPDPDCAAPPMTIHDSRTFTIVDAPAYGHHVRWELRRRRYVCKCGRMAHEPLPRYIDTENGVTARCNVLIRHEAARRPFLQVGAMVGLTEGVVRRIAKPVWKRKTPTNHAIRAPRYLGIDEIYLADPKDKENPHRQARTVLVDLETSNVLDVLDRANKADLIKRLRKFSQPERVRAITLDLSGTYRTAARKAFPNAVIVADRFHVEDAIQKAFDSVRVAEMKEHRVEGAKQTPFSSREYRTITRDLRAKTPPRSPARQERLAEFLAAFPRTCAAYDARNGFKAMWESGISIVEAPSLFEAWGQDVPQEIRRAFEGAVELIWKNKDVVFPYFGLKITNAATESANATIRRVSRVAPSLHLDTMRMKMIARGRLRPQTHYLCDGCGSREPIRGKPNRKHPDGEILTKTHPFTIRAGDLILYPDESCLCGACHTLAAAVDPAMWPKDRVFDLRKAGVKRPPIGLAAPFEDASQSGFRWSPPAERHQAQGERLPTPAPG